MDFSISETQKNLLHRLDAFLDGCGFDDAYFLGCEAANELPAAFFQALVQSGFGLLGIPEAYGGNPADALTLVLAAERLGARGFPPTLMMNVLQAKDMLAFGTPAQQQTVFRYLTQHGTGCFSFAISERLKETLATHQNGRVILSGHKAYITNGMAAPYILVLAKEADLEERPSSMYFVPKNAPGMVLKPLGRAGLDAELFLEDVTLDEDSLIGKQGEGFLQLKKHLEMERFAIAVSCLGMAECVFQDAVSYIGPRFAKKPGPDYQLVQEKLTYMHLKLQNMKRMVYELAWQKDQGESIRLSVSLSKLYCAQAAYEVADDALQLLGGQAYRDTHRVFRYWKELRGHRIGGGTDENMIQTAGKQILRQFTT